MADSCGLLVLLLFFFGSLPFPQQFSFASDVSSYTLKTFRYAVLLPLLGFWIQSLKQQKKSLQYVTLYTEKLDNEEYDSTFKFMLKLAIGIVEQFAAAGMKTAHAQALFLFMKNVIV